MSINNEKKKKTLKEYKGDTEEKAKAIYEEQEKTVEDELNKIK